MIDHLAVRTSLRTAAEQAATLLRSVRDPEARMPNSEWTIADAAAHMVTSMRTYGGWAVGRGDREDLDVGGVVRVQAAKINDARIATVPDRSPSALAGELVAATRTFLDETAELPAEAPFEWYGGITISLASISAIQLAELLVHGYDIAQTVRAPWPIAPRDAEQMVLGALALLPWYVNKETTQGVRASFEIRIRGGARVGIRLADGAATVESPPSGRYDCIISADPVALLLVSYGRIGVAKPTLTGKIVAFGRKPWLGLKFTSYFQRP